MQNPANEAATTSMLLVRELAIISILAIIVRLPWLLMIPSVEAPDEVTHMWVIRFCADNMRLPLLTDVQAHGPVAVYGSIPQFGYLPHIVLLKLLPSSSKLITMRLASLLASWVCVIAAYLIGRRIFPPNRLLMLALPLMLVFQPQFVFIGAYANNDVTAAALASIILLLLVKTLHDGLLFRNSLLMGFLLAWLALSKYSSYAVIPTAFIFFLLAAWLHKASLKITAFNLIAMLSPCLSLPGLWFWRNYHEFNGDITGARTLHYLWATTYHRNFDSYRSPLEIVLQTRWWRMNFFSFWGWFGYMTRSLPRPFYYGYLSFLILSVIGACKKLLPREDSVSRTASAKPAILHGERPLPAGAQDHRSDQDEGHASARILPASSRTIELSIWSMFIFLSVLNLLASLAGSSSGVAGPQGRYLFPSEIPLMALLLAGLSKFEGRKAQVLIWALLAFNLITYLYSSFFLYSLYGLSAH